MSKKQHNDNIDSINTDDIIPKDEKDRRCAPGIIFESGSCMRLKLLIIYATAYSNENTNKKIEMRPDLEIVNPKKYKKYLVRELTNRIGSAQRQWHQQPFAKNIDHLYKEELSKHTFRPEGPKGKFEWLNTLHIDDVMAQYQKKYPEFKFLGSSNTVPI